MFLRTTAVSCLFGAGIIHGVWMVMHLGEWLGAGIFFISLATTQTFGAFALAVLPGRLTYLAVSAINVATILVWTVSRTVGMPIGPEAGQPAPLGTADLVATFFEVLSVLALLPLLLRSPAAAGRAARAGRMPPRAYAVLASIPVYILVLTGVAVVPAAAGHEQTEHSNHGSHDHASHSHG